MRFAWGVTVTILIAGGCASTTERVLSPPAIVLDPPPRAGTPPIVTGQTRTPSYRDPDYHPPAHQSRPDGYTEPPPSRPAGTGVSDWLRSGRGLTWGAARHGPVRDLGLDRLMADTLGSSSPHYSNKSPTDASLVTSESWVYPATPVPRFPSQPIGPAADDAGPR